MPATDLINSMSNPRNLLISLERDTQFRNNLIEMTNRTDNIISLAIVNLFYRNYNEEETVEVFNFYQNYNEQEIETVNEYLRDIDFDDTALKSITDFWLPGLNDFIYFIKFFELILPLNERILFRRRLFEQLSLSIILDNELNEFQVQFFDSEILNFYSQKRKRKNIIKLIIIKYIGSNKYIHYLLSEETKKILKKANVKYDYEFEEPEFSVDFFDVQDFLFSNIVVKGSYGIIDSVSKSKYQIKTLGLFRKFKNLILLIINHDPEIFLIVNKHLINTNSDYFKHLSESLKYRIAAICDNELISKVLIYQNGSNLIYFKDRINEIDKDLLFDCIRKNVLNIKHLPLSHEFLDDESICKLIINSDGMFIRFFSDRLKNMPSIAIEAVKNSGDALQFLNEELKNDNRVIKSAAVKGDGEIKNLCCLTFGKNQKAIDEIKN